MYKVTGKCEVRIIDLKRPQTGYIKRNHRYGIFVMWHNNLPGFIRHDGLDEKYYGKKRYLIKEMED